MTRKPDIGVLSAVDVKDALCKIIRDPEIGVDRLLGDAEQSKNICLDFMRHLEMTEDGRLRKTVALSMFSPATFLLLVNNRNTNNKQRKTAAEQMVKMLLNANKSETRVTRELCQSVVMAFAEALGWDIDLVPPPPPPQKNPSLSPVRNPHQRTRSSGALKTLFRLAVAIGIGIFAFKFFNGNPDLVDTLILDSPQGSSSYTSNTTSGTSNQSLPVNHPAESVTTDQQSVPNAVVDAGDILYSCKGAIPQEFRVNSRAIVTTEQDRLIVRSSVGTDYMQLFRIYTGTIITVLSGPECAQGSSWWYVRVDKGTEVYNPLSNRNYYLDRDSEGWVRGGADDWSNDGESDHIQPIN